MRDLPHSLLPRAGARGRRARCAELSLLDRAWKAAYAGEARRGGRVVEGARLLSEYTAKSRIVGSNPILSARPN